MSGRTGRASTRFVEERLIPVQKEILGEEAFAQFPGLEIVEAPVHNYFAPLSRRSSSGILSVSGGLSSGQGLS